LFASFIQIGSGCVVALLETFVCRVVCYPRIGATIYAFTDGIGYVTVIISPHFWCGSAASRHTGLSVGIGIAAECAGLDTCWYGFVAITK